MSGAVFSHPVDIEIFPERSRAHFQHAAVVGAHGGERLAKPRIVGECGEDVRTHERGEPVRPALAQHRLFVCGERGMRKIFKRRDLLFVDDFVALSGKFIVDALGRPNRPVPERDRDFPL